MDSKEGVKIETVSNINSKQKHFTDILEMDVKDLYGNFSFN